MKAKISDYIICIMFLICIFAIPLLLIVLPEESFSEKEKRYLETAPEPGWSQIASGDFGTDVEKYVADHLPGRDLFVGLAANADRLMGLQSTKKIYVGRSGRLYEAPCGKNPAAVSRNMEAINSFADIIGQPVDFMLIPSAGYMMRDDMAALAEPYIDDELIAEAYSLAGKGIRCLDVFESFGGCEPEKLYYSTDHHWTSLGAYRAYRGYMSVLGREYMEESDYSVREVGGFYGSTYSRSCLWQYPSESLELWDAGGSYEVSFSDREETGNSLFFEERLKEADKYTVWLDGNHPLVRIENQDPEAEGELLVIRDSYSNCMGCFLADSYKTVVLADLRYYKLPLSELCQEEDFDNVLVAYSIGNFMSDGNIRWLE